MKGKLIKSIVVCLVVAGVAAGGFYGYNAFFPKKPTAASTRYYSANVKKMNLEVTVQGTGTAYAAITKEVFPNNDGTLKDLSVKVGDTVKEGQKLFVSDSDDIRKSVTTAKNNLTKQNLTLEADQSAEKIDENKIAMDKLSVSEAKTELSNANKKLSNMTVKAPIGGVVTAVNGSNGDKVQSSKSVLTIVDMNSIKIKVSVDELNITKIKADQKAVVKFDAIKDKTYEGVVETIAQTGTTTNNVTTYEVVVGIKEPAGIKLGMNGNVTISVESKEDALAIPAEALVEMNGEKYVRLQSNDTTNITNTNNKEQSAPAISQTQNGSGQENKGNTPANNNAQSGQTQKNYQNGASNNRVQNTSANGRLVQIKTGLETQNYIEVTEGLKEGDAVLVQLPQTTTTNNTNNRNDMRGFGGPDMGGMPPQGGPQGGAPRN